MNTMINPGPSALYDTENNGRIFILFFGISTACHIIVLLMLIISPLHKTGKNFTPSVINVDLVSFSAQQTNKQQSSAKPNAVVPAKPVAKKKVSTAKPKATVKKQPKENPAKPSQTVINKNAENTEADRLERVFDRLKNQVEQEGAARNSSVAAGSGEAAGGPGIESSRILEQMDIYKIEIYSIIQRNWSFPDRLAGNRTDLMTVLVIKIMPDGEIRDYWFEKKSGNSYLDDSSLKAVLKANPLPPLPPGYRKPYFEVGLRFTPSGVK